jgi:hypothetical protein
MSGQVHHDQFCTKLLTMRQASARVEVTTITSTLQALKFIVLTQPGSGVFRAAA